MWRTTDVKTANTATTGPTWTAIKSPVATNNITAIAVAPGNPDIIWVGHDSSGAIYKAINGTAAVPTWVSQASGTPARRVLSIAIDPANSNTVYVWGCPTDC